MSNSFFEASVLPDEIPLWNRDGLVVAVARVDAENYDEIAGYRWYRDRDGYAVRATSRAEMAGTSLMLMHRQIMRCVKGDGVKVDHLDHDKLNNRKENLRRGSHSDNLLNQRPDRQRGACGHRNVYFVRGKYRPRVTVKGKHIYLGSYLDLDEAVEVVEKWWKEFEGVRDGQG